MNPIRSIFENPINSFGIFGNLAEFARKFTEFARNPIGSLMGMRNINIPKDFNGSPEELVRYLRNSGQMSQDQFDNFSKEANQLINMLPKF